MLPGMTYCSVGEGKGQLYIYIVGSRPREMVMEEQEVFSVGGLGKLYTIPPDFLAPSLFPGPSFALFTAPCAL